MFSTVCGFAAVGAYFAKNAKLLQKTAMKMAMKMAMKKAGSVMPPALSFQSVFYSVMLFGLFGVVPSVQRTDKISRDSADALELHALAALFGFQLISLFHVAAPTIPSAVRPFAFWKALTASSVFAPNLPSTVPQE